MPEEITQELDDAAKLAALTAEFEAFKQKVRAEAARVKGETGWCEDGVNKTLGRLGLPSLPKPKTYVFEVDTAGVLRYEIRAIDPTTAREQFEQQVKADSGTSRLQYGCKVGALVPNLETVRTSGGHTAEELAAPPIVTDDDEDDEDEDNDY